MVKPVVTTWQDIPTISLQQYERYLPSAFDEELSLLQKVNKVIKYLDSIGVLLNGIGAQWNEIVDWVMGEGLESAVNAKLEEWLANGTIADLIADLIMNLDTIKADITALQTDVQNLKDQNVNINNFPRLTGETDDTARIQRAVNFAETFGGGIKLNKATYTITATIEQGNVEIDGGDATIVCTSGVAVAFHSKGTLIKTITAGITDFKKGDRYLNIADTSGIQAGDIAQVVSTELYHTSRAYYYKGGMTQINKVYVSALNISTHFPFNLTGNTLTINIYRPKKPRLKDITIVRTGTLDETQDGVYYEFCKSVKLEGVFVGGFCRNVRLSRCLYNTIDRLETGECYYEGGATCYGLALYSCTNTDIKNCNLPLGRHGLVVSGQECCFNTTLETTTIGNNYEPNVHALDAHDCNYDMTLINCETTSLGISGNCKFLNCRFSNKTADNKGVIKLRYHTSYEYANYLFENCKFISEDEDYVVFEGDSYGQLQTETANAIGRIELKNCDGFLKFDLNIRNTYQFTYTAPFHGTIDTIDISNHRKSVYFITHDNIGSMKLDNVYSKTNIARFFNQYDTTTYIDRLELKNCGIPSRVEAVNLKNFGRVVFRDCYLTNVDAGTGKGMIFAGGDMVAMEHCTFASIPFDRGLEFSGIGTLALINTNVALYGGTATGVTTVKQV